MAIFLSGSRMSLILFSAYFIVLNIKLTTIKIVMVILLFTSVYLLYDFSYVGSNFTDNYDRLLDSFDLSEPGNVHRFSHWMFFKNKILSFENDNLFFGKQLGYLMTDANIYETKHFESSVITLFVETGIIGVFVFYFLVFIYALNKCESRLYKVWIFLIFFNSFFVPTYPGYMLMLSMGLVIGYTYHYDRS
jgi:hypothetical protein